MGCDARCSALRLAVGNGKATSGSGCDVGCGMHCHALARQRAGHHSTADAACPLVMLLQHCSKGRTFVVQNSSCSSLEAEVCRAATAGGKTAPTAMHKWTSTQQSFECTPASRIVLAPVFATASAAPRRQRSLAAAVDESPSTCCFAANAPRAMPTKAFSADACACTTKANVVEWLQP
jgi:hypothetical protein